MYNGKNWLCVELMLNSWWWALPLSNFPILKWIRPFQLYCDFTVRSYRLVIIYRTLEETIFFDPKTRSLAWIYFHRLSRQLFFFEKNHSFVYVYIITLIDTMFLRIFSLFYVTLICYIFNSFCGQKSRIANIKSGLYIA